LANQATNYLEGKIVEHVLRNVSFTSPATVYLALFSSATDEAGSGTELAGNGYSRQAITFGAHSGGTCTNSNTVTFGPASANWATVTDAAIMDAATTGNMLIYGVLAASKTVNSGESLQFSVGQISVQVL